MNFPLISRFLGAVSYLVGVAMLFSIPWTFEILGGNREYESKAFFGLLFSAVISFFVGTLLRHFGRNAETTLLRKEAMAIVALSWILATILGALPYLFSQTDRDVGVRMSVIDALFETQSGLSTTGASVISELEDPFVVPRAILFWRSTTHFLGGVGFMALFVVLLGQGASGKAVIRMEQTKMSGSSPQTTIRQNARLLLRLYIGLNVALALLLMLQGLSLFDAVCHAFGTIATGGFSTYNLSVGHFAQAGYRFAASIEWTITIFMFLSGTNFILLYWCCLGQFTKILGDLEWRTYVGIVLVATLLVFGYGLYCHDFCQDGPVTSLRTSCFHVVSLMTTTGFVTTQFELWNSLSLLILIVLFIIGGCSGSTAGGTKVIRWVLVYLESRQMVERSWRPNVVRAMKMGDKEIDKDTISNVMTFLLVYLIMILFLAFLVLMIEPTQRWIALGKGYPDKLLDALSASLSCFSNVGPAFGITGARENFAGYAEITKFFFIWAMLLGRLELFAIISIFMPSFWKQR